MHTGEKMHSGAKGGKVSPNMCQVILATIQLTAIYASLNTHFPWLQLFSGFAQESVDDKIKKVLKVFRGGRSPACRTDTENWRTRSGSPRRRGGEILKSQNDLLLE